jgi:hypothetical protein
MYVRVLVVIGHLFIQFVDTLNLPFSLREVNL